MRVRGVMRRRPPVVGNAGRRPAVQAVAPLRDDQWTQRLQARERPLHVLRGVVEVR